MEITDIIGNGKSFETPFHVREETNTLADFFAVLDRNNTPFCWGIFDKTLPQHSKDYLKSFQDEIRRTYRERD